MARKREVKPVPATEAPSEVKAVRLELTPELHQQLRVVAAQHGQSMASYVRTLVMQELARPKGGGK
jgi:plasmid stability protein